MNKNLKGVTIVILFVMMVGLVVVSGPLTNRIYADEPEVAVPSPTLIGPIPFEENQIPGDYRRGYTFFSRAYDLPMMGYVEEEFFMEGTANRYAIPEEGPAEIIDGGWPYRTRIVVRRPADHSKFSGVVFLEWQNVGQGYDLEPLWTANWKYYVTRGHAWVGVSCQRNGIDDPETGLKVWSPDRYGSLDVTVGGTFLDDELMYDIYSQAAQALRNPVGVDPMGGLGHKLEMILQCGASPGQTRAYYTHIEPLHRIIDGYYFQRGGYDFPAEEIEKPTLHIMSEAEVRIERIQEDSEHFRQWQIAGVGHYTYWSGHNSKWVRDRDGIDMPNFYAFCPYPYTRVPDTWVSWAGMDHLIQWITTRGHLPPPVAPRIDFDEEGRIARDEHGIALGGIRLPAVEVPTALNVGERAVASEINPGICAVTGAHVPFDAATLQALYPTHEYYVTAVEENLDELLSGGFITTEGYDAMLEEAIKADVPPAP
jgi:hypothetical protein